MYSKIVNCCRVLLVMVFKRVNWLRLTICRNVNTVNEVNKRDKPKTEIAKRFTYPPEYTFNRTEK